MKHRQRADKQNEIDDQGEICDETGNFVVDAHAHEGDDQADQTSENAGPNRICTQCGRDAALFLNAHRRLQWVLQDARQTRALLPR